MPLQLVHRYTCLYWSGTVFGCHSEGGSARRWYRLLTSSRKSQLQGKPNLITTFGKSPLLQCEIHGLHQTVTAPGSHRSLQRGTKTCAIHLPD